jgi:uncharacterized membrane protein
MSHEITATRAQARTTGAPQLTGLQAISAGDLRWLLVSSLFLIALVALSEYMIQGRAPSLLSPILPISQFLRLPLGLVYVLLAPGYAISAALFPRRGDIDGIERAGLSLGLSVAWLSLLVLILDRLPWGLSLWPILLGLLASVGLFVAVALFRRAMLPVEVGYTPGRWRPQHWWRGQTSTERRLYLFCVLTLLLAGFAIAWLVLVPSPDEFTTEFYILGREGLAENYPRQAAPGEILSVTMGIANHQQEATTYHVQVWAVDPWDGREEIVERVGPLSLARGETVEQPLRWQMPWPGQDQQVEFRLYDDRQASGDKPYRLLRLWLSVTD